MPDLFLLNVTSAFLCLAMFFGVGLVVQGTKITVIMVLLGPVALKFALPSCMGLRCPKILFVNSVSEIWVGHAVSI